MILPDPYADFSTPETVLDTMNYAGFDAQGLDADDVKAMMRRAQFVVNAVKKAEAFDKINRLAIDVFIDCAG